MLPRKYIVLGLILLNLGTLVLSYFKKETYPVSTDIASQLYAKPIQNPTTATTFQQTVNNITYTIQPRFNYELSGLVVSWHNSDSWLDYVHNYWNDYINLKDLCLVWDTNLSNNTYQRLTFSNGSFSCSYHTNTTEAWQAFNESAVANTHLLAANPEIAAQIMRTSRGDQVYLQGYLVDYSTSDGWHRTTSVTRDDRGMGACEIIYVTAYKILRHNHPVWHLIYRISQLTLGLILAIKIIAWFIYNRPKAIRLQ